MFLGLIILLQVLTVLEVSGRYSGLELGRLQKRLEDKQSNLVHNISSRPQPVIISSARPPVKPSGRAGPPLGRLLPAVASQPHRVMFGSRPVSTATAAKSSVAPQQRQVIIKGETASTKPVKKVEKSVLAAKPVRPKTNGFGKFFLFVHRLFTSIYPESCFA